MVDDVLLRRGEDIAATNRPHLMDVAQDVLTHAFLQILGVAVFIQLTG